MEQFKNLIEVTTFFADQAKATDYLIRMRWPNGIKCVHCEHDKVYELKGANKRFKCANCRRQFSATVGTIFENSPIPLQKWFMAMYLIASHKKGISSCQLGRDLSLTQKSAWFVLHRVRFVFQTGTFVHSKDAIIEIDETFVGGETANKHECKIERNDRGHAISTKVPVIGILERGGCITTKAVKDTQKDTLLPEIKANVTKGTMIMTDSYPGYTDLSKDYIHDTVNHSEKEYVRGNTHTNGIENFWSLFQRGVIGIYHHTSAKHLDKYLDEFEFRFNTRKNSEGERFGKAVSLVNKRLTYAQLIDNGEDKSFYKFRPEHE